MTLGEALTTARTRAAQSNTNQAVLYDDADQSPDYRLRYRVTRFNYAISADDKRLRYVVAPNGHAQLVGGL